jgi:hypothetical protein
VYCEFCRSNAVANEDENPVSLIEVSPQIETDEHGHDKEDAEKEEKQQQLQQLEPEKQEQQQPVKPVVEVNKKIRIERSKEGIHLKAAPLPREEGRNNDNSISHTDHVSG